MVGIGVVGAVVAVFGTVVGWVFVGQVASASDDSIEVTIQTLEAVDDTIDLEVSVTLVRVLLLFGGATLLLDDLADDPGSAAPE